MRDVDVADVTVAVTGGPAAKKAMLLAESVLVSNPVPDMTKE